MRYLFHIPTAIAAISLSTLLIGCGGGAATETTVTIKSADSSSEDGDGNGDSVEIEGYGTLTGKVIFEGTPPSLDPLIKAGSNVKDSAVCAAETVPDESLVVGEGGGVANVFVYLARKPKGVEISPVPEEPVVFDQKGCKFIPHAIVTRTGQTVKILSDDAIAHNTHTLPKNNPVFNTVIKANDRDGVPLVYNDGEPEPVQVICDFHTWMKAYHMPLDHPFVALTDANGNFEIKDLPAGDHEFRVWHEAASGGYIDRKLKVTIKVDGTTDQDIKYPASKVALNGNNGAQSVKLSSLSR